MTSVLPALCALLLQTTLHRPWSLVWCTGVEISLICSRWRMILLIVENVCFCLITSVFSVASWWLYCHISVSFFLFWEKTCHFFMFVQDNIAAIAVFLFCVNIPLCLYAFYFLNTCFFSLLFDFYHICHSVDVWWHKASPNQHDVKELLAPPSVSVLFLFRQHWI